MTTLLLYPLLSTALFFLLARATITAWLWSRYPPALDRFLNCAACSGTWYGLGLGLAIGLPLDLPFLGLAARTWYTPLFVAGCSMIWTPMIAAVHQLAMQSLGMPAEAAPTAPTGVSYMPEPEPELPPGEAARMLESLQPLGPPLSWRGVGDATDRVRRA